MALAPQMPVPMAISPPKRRDSPKRRPRKPTTVIPAAIARITKGRATSVNFPALNRLRRIPRSMMPIRRRVVEQNFSPSAAIGARFMELDRTMPRIMASMIALTGLLVRPNTDSPIQSAR